MMRWTQYKSELGHLCLQCHKIILKDFVLLDIALHRLQVPTELLRDAGILLLHARQSVLYIAVEPVQFPCTIQFLISSLHLCQESLPGIPTASNN